MMTPEIKKRIEQIRRGEIPNGYKKTKVGIVPAQWGETHFKKMFSRLTRKNGEGNTNVLTISAQHGLISQEDFFNKSVASDDKSNYFLLYNGEFAYNKSYSNGYPYGALKRLDFYDKGVVSPLYICFIKTNQNKCPDYYVHYFEGGLMNHEIQAFAQEGARNHGLLNISVNDFFNSYLLCPPFLEQKKISKILTLQDKVVELKEKLIFEKQQQKKYLMQQLLTGKKRFSCSLNKWKTYELNQLSKKQKAKNTGFQYSLVLSNSAQHGIVPQDEQFDKEIANTGRTDGYYIVKDGDFVYNPRISVTAPCGPINRNETGSIGIISPLYTVFTIDLSIINYEFIKQYFKSTCWFRYMKSVANYGARHDRLSVSDEDFFAMPIPLPEITEQRKISQILSTADHEIELLQQDLEAEKQKKKALMQLLLMGIVRVKV